MKITMDNDAYKRNIFWSPCSKKTHSGDQPATSIHACIISEFSQDNKSKFLFSSIYKLIFILLVTVALEFSIVFQLVNTIRLLHQSLRPVALYLWHK